MVLALTVIGPSATLDADPASKQARELKRSADAISAQLGLRTV
jgi:DNA-binding IclR family transcriptional regulator